MASNTILVTKIDGQAWVRESDGSLTPLREGMHIPADAEVVTANSGSSVQLQPVGQSPLTIGEGREVRLSAEVARSDVEVFDAAAAAGDSDTARVIDALDAGDDPFDELDPTAAVIQGGSADAGGSSFTRLLNVVELTTPLALEYPRPSWPTPDEIRLGGFGGVGNRAPELTGAASSLTDQINDDSDAIDGLNVGQYFTDPDGHSLTFSATGLPPGLTINPNTGVITGQLDSSASQGGPGSDGIYNVVVTATDPFGASVSLPFTWTTLNPPPVAEDDTATTEENTIVTGNVLTGDPVTGEGQDVDPDGDTLTVVEITNTAGDKVPAGTPISGINGQAGKGGGSVTIHPDGSYTFDPGTDFDYLAEGETTTTTVTYKISDGDGGFDEATLTITVTGTNDTPVVAPVGSDDDAATVVEVEDGHADENVITHVKQGQLSFSDPDDNDQHQVSLKEPVPAGYVGDFDFTVNSDNTIDWTFKVDDSAIDHLGKDQTLVQEYVIVVDDGKGGIAEQTVTITIVGTNDAPVITSDADQHQGTVTEDASETTATGTLTYEDADNDQHDSQTWALVGDDGVLADRIEGVYGYLELRQDGTWTYHLDNDRAATNALKEGEEVTETFTARITDTPGAYDEQDITITIVGSTEGIPSIVPDDKNDDGLVDGHVTVNERGLAEDGDGEHIAEGTIKVSADDGLASITIGGTSFTLQELLQLSQSSPSDEIDVGHGKIVLTGFTQDASTGGVATEGTLHYTYELGAARTHGTPGSDTDKVKNLSVDLSVTSVDSATRPGETHTGELIVHVRDDTPTIALQEGNLGSVDALMTKDANTKGDAEDVVTADFSGIFAIDDDVTDAGADGQQGDIEWGYVLGIADNGVSGLKSAGQDITLTLENGVVHGKAGTTPVFTVAVDAKGNVTLTQYAPIDHDDPHAHDEIIALAEGSVTLTATATIRDGDGDTAFSDETVDISNKITFKDDGPSIGDPAAGVVKEAHLVSGSLETDSTKTTITGALDVDFGADASSSRDTYFTTDVIEQLNELGLTSDKVGLTYSLDASGHVLTAKAGNTDIFTITITDPSGAPGYQFELQGAIDHSTEGESGQTIDQILTLPFNVKDADGDTDKESFQITIKDDSGLGDEHSLELDEDTSITFNTSADGTSTNITIGEGAATDKPQFGTATVNDDGSITYTPRENFSGTDRFTYTTEENGVKTTTTVNITVNPVADAPAFAAGGDAKTDEDVAVALGLNAPKVTDGHDRTGNLDDMDNPERLGEITLSGFPAGAVLQLADGTDASVQPDAQGIVRITLTGDDAPAHISTIDQPDLLTLTVEQFEGLQVLPPPESNKNFSITAKVTSFEVDSEGKPLSDVNGAETVVNVDVTVEAVTDPIKLEYVADGGDLAKQGVIMAKEDNAFNLKDYLEVSFPDAYENGSSGDGNSGPDVDGSEERWFEISGLPAGTTIEDGEVIDTSQEDGTLTIKVKAPGLSTSASDLPDIWLTTPKDFSGTLEGIKVTLVAVDRDKDSSIEDGKREESSIDLTLHVDPEGGDVSAPGVTTPEDTPVAFMEGLMVTDKDVGPTATYPELGERITAITVKGIPADWTLKDAAGNEIDLGSPGDDGTYQFTVPTDVVGAKDWDGYTLTPPAHSSKDAIITLEVTTVDTTIVDGKKVSSDPFTKELPINITVTPVAEVIGQDEVVDTDGDGTPDLTMTEGHTYGPANRGSEDEWFKLNVQGFSLADDWTNQDAAIAGGSEETFALLAPKWLDMSQGESGERVDAIGSRFSYELNGQTIEVVYSGEPGVQIPVAALDSVQFLPPQHLAGKFDIKVQALTVDHGDDASDKPVSAISGEAWLSGIEIAPVVDPVSLTTTGARGLEDSFIALNIQPHSADPSETFNVKIEAIPTGSTFAYGVGDARVEVQINHDGTITVMTAGDELVGDAAVAKLGELGVAVGEVTEGAASLTITDYVASGNPAIKPPHNSNDDFTLRVSAQAVDETPELGLIDQTGEGDWAEHEITVRVKGVADPADVVLKAGADDQPVTMTEDAVEADGIALSALVDAITLTDTDGSESLSVKLTGLPAGFDVEGGSIFARGEGAEREWLIPVNNDGSISDDIKIMAPENYSGELAFQLISVTTENDGDSLTSAPVDVVVHVTPTPEAMVNSVSAIKEDIGGLLKLDLSQPKGENEELTAIWIKANDITDNGFELIIEGKTLAELAADPDFADVSHDDTHPGYIKITGKYMHAIHAKADPNFADNIEGQDKLQFAIKTEITDYRNDDKDDSAIAPVSEITEGKHTLDVTPVTDAVAVELADDQPETVAIGSDVTLDITLAKVPDSNAGDKADVDGSEQFVQLLINGPDGLLLDGMKVDGAEFNHVSYLGNGQWILHIPESEYPVFQAGDTNPNGLIHAQLQFKSTPFLESNAQNGQHQMSVTVVTQDRGAESRESATIDWAFSSSGTGDGEALSTIETIDVTSKNYQAKEDTTFSLGDAFDASVSVTSGSDNVSDVHFSLVLDNLPEGASLDAGSVTGLQVNKVTGDDGDRWIITGTVSGIDNDAKNAALEGILQGIDVILPENWNDNLDEDGFPLDVTFTAYLDNGSQEYIDPDTFFVPVAPVTDAGIITVSFAALGDDSQPLTDDEGNPVHAQEGRPVLISLDVSSPDDHGDLGLGSTVYFQLGTEGFGDEGTLTYLGHVVELITVSETDALDGMTAGEQYYQISTADGSPLTMPLDLVYTPAESDQYVDGSLQVKAWIEHQEDGAENWKTAFGDSQMIPVDKVNNGYEFEGIGDTVVVDGAVTAKGIENQDGEGKVALNITGSLVDDDGSEMVHNAVLKGLPVGFLVYVGTQMAANTGTSADGTFNTWSIPLDANGNLPDDISIQPPLNWSGTLDGLTLAVLSGEKEGVDDVAETVLNITLEVEPRPDGIESLQPALAFGQEGDIVALRLNLTMKDDAPAGVSGADDESYETVSLRLDGLGTHAAFYVRDAEGNYVLLSKDQIVRNEDGTYELSGLTQDEANNLGFIQSESAVDGDDGKINVEVWTVESGAPEQRSESVKQTFQVDLTTQKATSGDDTLLFDGASLLDGGDGHDTVWLRFGEDIDFAAMRGDGDDEDSGVLFRNIETLDLTRPGFDHALTNLSVEDVLDMTDDNNVLTIRADDGDIISLLEGWERADDRSVEAAEGQPGKDVYVDSSGNTSAELHIEADPEFLKQVADSLKTDSGG